MRQLRVTEVALNQHPLRRQQGLLGAGCVACRASNSWWASQWRVTTSCRGGKHWTQGPPVNPQHDDPAAPGILARPEPVQHLARTDRKDRGDQARCRMKKVPSA